MNNFFTKISLKAGKDSKDGTLVKTDVIFKIAASILAIGASAVTIKNCGKSTIDNSVEINPKGGGSVIAPVVNGNSNSVIIDRSDHSQKFDDSFNSNSGNINLGSQSNSGNSASAGSKQLINSDDHSTTYNATNITINQYYHSASNESVMPETNPPVAPKPQKSAHLSFPFGQTRRIEFSAANKSANIYKGSFYLDIEQGDKLAFDVSSVNGAAMKLTVRVFVEGKGPELESSRQSKNSVQWIMQKGIPGTKARFEIRTDSPGAMDVRVDKAN